MVISEEKEERESQTSVRKRYSKKVSVVGLVPLKESSRSCCTWDSFRKYLFNVCASRPFNIAINMIIISNTVCLSLNQYPMDFVLIERLAMANLYFFVIFSLEMAIKLIGLGPRLYVKDIYNIFDGTVGKNILN